MTPAQGQGGRGKSTSKAIRNANRREKAKEDMMTIFPISLVRNDALSSIFWNGSVVVHLGAVSLTTQHRQQIIWDVYEHNFRFELLCLDICIMSTEWESPSGGSRDEMVRSVFPGETYLVGDLPHVDEGLAAADLEQRQAYVIAFSALLSTWPGRTPTMLAGMSIDPSADVATRTRQVTAVEDLSVPFYCQTFFDYFA